MGGVKKDPKGCVYKINCDCGQSYIGQSCRPLSVRIKEHQAAARNGTPEKSAVAEHLSLHNWKKRMLREALAIQNLKPELNRDEGHPLPKLWTGL